ncbi:MAG: hypothetical protein PHG66_00285 [Candidatus Colwellbacteria bacterium]|nr:hypothetical protein [Candidatus Colwellbacteria bacterium]
MKILLAATCVSTFGVGFLSTHLWRRYSKKKVEIPVVSHRICYHCDGPLSERVEKCKRCYVSFCSDGCSKWISSTDPRCESCESLGEAMARGSKKRLAQCIEFGLDPEEIVERGVVSTKEVGPKTSVCNRNKNLRISKTGYIIIDDDHPERTIEYVGKFKTRAESLDKDLCHNDLCLECGRWSSDRSVTIPNILCSFIEVVLSEHCDSKHDTESNISTVTKYAPRTVKETYTI